ncbi:MAG: phage tail tape measure protein [Bacillota bacterium]
MRTTQGFAQTATGLLVPLSAVERTERRVEQASRQMEQQTRRTAAALREKAKEAQVASQSVDDLLQTLGALGLVSGAERALRGITGTTREFGAIARQASLIAEDYTGALERQALAATEGIYGPIELAEAYRELGAAGAEVNEVLAAAPEILDFATAAMIDQADAAQAVIAAASSFRIPLTEASRITDAFAEAMNRTTLGGRDLVYALASIGPVAAIANQQLGETIAAVAALRNAGASAQDAATSVRSAMLHLANPTQEAAELIQYLGIQLYDAQGNMKQWSDIVAEFERALAPFNQQARNMILTTIFGSDGIRAMAASMQMGSDNLRRLARDLENAEGAASAMARTMGDTLDGALRRLAGNTQRAAIVFGQDLQPAIVSVVGFIDRLVAGFVHLDDATRGLIEVILGGAGLVVALASVARIIQLLVPGLTAAISLVGQARTAIVGLATGTQALSLSLGSVLGILGVVAGVLGVGYLAWKTYRTGMEQATLAGVEEARVLYNKAQRIRELTEELKTLAANTNPTAEEQARLRDVTEELARLAPLAAQGIDEQTGAITDLTKVLEGANAEMEKYIEQSESMAKAALAIAQIRLPQLEEELQQVDEEMAKLTRARDLGPEFARGQMLAEPRGPTIPGLSWLGSLLFGESEAKGLTQLRMLITGDPAKIEAEAAVQLTQLRQRAFQLKAEINELKEMQRVAEALLRGEDPSSGRSGGGGAQTTPATTGGRGLPPDFGRGRSGPSWLEQWRNSLQATLHTLAPYEQALARASGRLDILNAKQAYYLALLRDGKGGIELLIEAEKTRDEVVQALRQHQEELHRTNEAYRAMLVTLGQEQERLDALYAAGKISREDYAEASRRVREETERLNQAIARNSAAWWQDELAIAQAGETLEQVLDRMEQDVRQKFEEVMRKGREELEKFAKAVDDLFAKLDRTRDARGLQNVLADLRQAADTLRALASGGTLGPAPLFTGGDLGPAAKAAMAQADQLLQDILGGKYAPDTSTLLDLSKTSREQFLQALGDGLGRLDDLLRQAQELARPLADELKAIVAGLDQQIRGIQAVLDDFETTEAADRQAKAWEELNRALDALEGIRPEGWLPGPDDVRRLADEVQRLRLQDLGALEPEEFAQRLRENLGQLRHYSQVARNYLQSAADAIDAELRDIDRQIKAIDERLQRDLERLQAQLDALDRQERQDERLKAEEEYQKRRKALQDQITWLMLQGEEKHAFEIAALRRQLADEEAKWQEQLTKWQREDQRERIRQQMDALREQAEAEKQALEERRRMLLEQQVLLNRSLEALLEVIAGEQQGLMDLARQRQEDLRSLQQQAEEKYRTLEDILGDIRTYVDQELGEWRRLADERRKIEEDAWNNQETGIKAIMDRGITETLALMAEKDPLWLARGQSMMDALIQGIRSREQSLRDAIEDVNRALAELDAARMLLNEAPQDTGGRVTVDVPGFASGAVLFRPVAGLMALAERGPEAIAPLDWLADQIRELADRSVRQTLVATLAPVGVAGGVSARDLADALRQAIREAGPLRATVPVYMDGRLIAEHTVELAFSGFRQEARRR